MVKHLHNHKGSPTKDVVTSIWALPVWAGWPKLCLPSTAGLAGLLKKAGSAPPWVSSCKTLSDSSGAKKTGTLAYVL